MGTSSLPVCTVGLSAVRSNEFDLGTELERCVTDRLEKLEFRPPQGNGMIEVNFPFQIAEGK